MTIETIREFIGMFDKDIQINEVHGEDYEYEVLHEENKYLCPDLNAAGDCVNHIVYDLGMYRAVQLCTTGETIRIGETE